MFGSGSGSSSAHGGSSSSASSANAQTNARTPVHQRALDEAHSFPTVLPVSVAAQPTATFTYQLRIRGRVGRLPVTINVMPNTAALRAALDAAPEDPGQGPLRDAVDRTRAGRLSGRDPYPVADQVQVAREYMRK
jgi:hypothetical protein